MLASLCFGLVLRGDREELSYTALVGLIVDVVFALFSVSKWFRGFSRNTSRLVCGAL